MTSPRACRRPPLLDPQIEDVVQVDVGQQRRDRRPLGRAFLAGRPPAVLDHACSEPFLDQAQDPPVRDPVLEELHQPGVIQAAEEVPEIQVEHPVHLAILNRDRERIQRVMLSATGPKPVGEPQEVRLIDGVQHLNHGALDDLVLQRGDPERPKPPIGLGDVHPARRPGPVSAPLNPGVQIPKIPLQVLPIGIPRLAVDPRGRLRAQRPIRTTEAIDINMMQERGEPRVPVLRGNLPHTLQRT